MPTVLEGGDDQLPTELGKQFKTHSASSDLALIIGLVHNYYIKMGRKYEHHL